MHRRQMETFRPSTEPGRREQRTFITGVLAALLSMLCGCSSLDVFSKNDSEKRAEQLDAVQFKAMQFADEYVGQIIGPLNTLQAQTLDPRVRLDAQNWKVSQSTAAYTNASEPNPVNGALDMVVLAVLSRMVVEEDMANPAGRLRSTELREAHRKLEKRAWELSSALLDLQQRTNLRTAIEKWRAANRNVRAVSLVHFGDVSQTLIPSESEGIMSKGLLGLIGIEPLRGLDPAVREIAQTRQLAQRSVYYIQRAPGLLDMQVERLVYQFTVMPEARLLLENTDRVADAAQRAGHLADVLPTLISQERAAAITQISTDLNAQQDKTRALARDLRELLDSATLTANSATTTITSLDALIARFKSSEPRAAASYTAAPNERAESPTGAPQVRPRDEPKPSAIGDYIQVLRELSSTTAQLQGLIVALDQGAGGVEKVASAAVANGKSLLDYLVLRAILLAAAIALIIVVSVLACRVASRRLV